MIIKWDQPEMIEVTMGAFVVQDYGDRINYSDGLYTVYVDDLPRKFWPDGRSAGSHPYAIRNKQAPAQPAPSPELVSAGDGSVCVGCGRDPELVERMVAFVRDIAENEPLARSAVARAILAELEPKPDPLAEVWEDAARLYQEWLDDRRSAQEFLARVLCAERGIELGERK